MLSYGLHLCLLLIRVHIQKRSPSSLPLVSTIYSSSILQDSFRSLQYTLSVNYLSNLYHLNGNHKNIMHFSLSLSSLPILLSLTHATNIPIKVGADAKLLAFNPQVVTANIGDTLTFSYFPKNHSIVQSSFADPCHPLANGFSSGFQP
ncbi:hypothetical protein N7G274_010766 [Stereocaulon virgatum]|uniref:Uncharacterized protein n=1 Tax=Stereocaulon virgatum TaxID=373712 RepID=A0ABR3ZSY1_9LECA